jgi:hypothetical protein
VWGSLAHPDQPGARPWLVLLDDEVPPRVLAGRQPTTVVWSSLWPSRPRDEVRLELSDVRAETLLTFTVLTPDDPPDPSKAGHIRRRLNQLLFADLRFSYGQ